MDDIPVGVKLNSTVRGLDQKFLRGHSEPCSISPLGESGELGELISGWPKDGDAFTPSVPWPPVASECVRDYVFLQAASELIELTQLTFQSVARRTEPSRVSCNSPKTRSSTDRHHAPRRRTSTFAGSVRSEATNKSGSFNAGLASPITFATSIARLSNVSRHAVRMLKAASRSGSCAIQQAPLDRRDDRREQNRAGCVINKRKLRERRDQLTQRSFRVRARRLFRHGGPIGIGVQKQSGRPLAGLNA